MQQSQMVQQYVNEEREREITMLQEPVHRFKHLLWPAASHKSQWKFGKAMYKLGTHSLIGQHSSGASRGSSGWCKLPEPRRLLWWACHAVYIAGLALVGRHVGHVHLLLTLQCAIHFSCPEWSCLKELCWCSVESVNQPDKL